MAKKTQRTKPFPVLSYFVVLFILVACGICVSVYLSVSHYKVYTDTSYSSFCAISKAINCDTVSQSPYSIFIGVPVPIWGVIGYVFFLITLLLSFNIKTKKFYAFSSLFFITILFSAISIFLGIISTVKIHSYCIMCIVTYGINFMLMYMIWLIRRRFTENPWRALIKKDLDFWIFNKIRAIKFYIPLILIIITVMVYIPQYWRMTSPVISEKSTKTGLTNDGSPWIGAEHPELTIIEYADYMCFQCRKMHFFLRTLVNKHPKKIRIIHKHFPMDNKFNTSLKENLHPGSGILSSIAIVAEKKDKFWQLNDYLYNYKTNHKAIYLREIAEETGLELKYLKTQIYSSKVKIKLQRDIAIGLKKNVRGTPSYIIDEKLYVGLIPAEILEPYTK